MRDTNLFQWRFALHGSSGHEDSVRRALGPMKEDAQKEIEKKKAKKDEKAK